MSDRLEKLHLCPDVRVAITQAQKLIPEKGAQVVVCGRCQTQFDVTANGAFPLADYCVYSTSQLTPDSQTDGFFEEI